MWPQEKKRSYISLAIFYINKADTISFHFKELFALDGKRANITVNDVQRRNRIIQLLLDWGLVSIVSTDKVNDIAPLNQIKVISYKEKNDWNLETKYNIGKRKKPEED